MKSLSLFVWLLVTATAAIPAHAQLFGSGIVYDPTQSAHAVSQIREAEQLYTTASQTRDQVVEAYNLARHMSQMPQDLYRRYAAEFSRWTTFNAADTYGNTADWITAANSGASDRATSAVTKAGIPLQVPTSALSSLDPTTQAVAKAQLATAELSDGVSAGALVTLGQIRAHSQALNKQISTLERDSYSPDPSQQTEMAVLGKINAANLMELRSQQDANQILSTAAMQQMIAAKEQADAQKRALNQAVYFEQNFSDSIGKLTNGMSQSIGSIAFSTRP